MSQAVPSTGSALSAVASLTLRRLLRGKAIWVGIVIASLPMFFAVAIGISNKNAALEDTFVIELLLLGIIPPLYVASSIGEEIEDRTATYLWSRPVARWCVLVGKLLALVPVTVALITLSWVVAIQIALHEPPPVHTIIALAAGALAVGLLAAGIATLVPKHGMALTLVYLLLVDLPIGEIPASIQRLSVTHGVRDLTYIGSDSTIALYGVIELVAISGVWLFVALRRIRRLET